MAQTGYTPIQLYYSSTTTNVPLAANLSSGELAINTADGKLFYKDSSNVVQVIGTKGGVGSSATTQVLYNSSGLVVGNANLTFNGTTLTASAFSGPLTGNVTGNVSGTALNVTGTVAIANGGTGATTAQTAINALSGGVTSGSYLRGNGTNVVLSTIQAADVPTLNQNTTGTSSNVTGTVAIANGGTGSTTAGAALTALGAQATLVSGTNIKTINSTSLLGSGNLTVVTSAAGSNTEIQFNNFGSFASSSGLTWNAGSSTLTANTLQVTNNSSISGLSVGKGYSYQSECTAFGVSALASTSNTANSNTAIGYQTLFSNTTGTGSVAIGSTALKYNTTGNYNTAIGYQSMWNTSTGYSNTAVGYQTLQSTNTGIGNSAFGTAALYSNTSGLYNTAIGSGSLYANTTGTSNVAIGNSASISAVGAYYTVAIGFESLYSNVAGFAAVAIGYGSQYYANNSASGYYSYNISIGYQSLRGSTTAANNTGISNIAIGYQPLYSNTTGSDNVSHGYQSLYTNSTGSKNIALGSFSLQTNSTGNQNVAIGYNALISATTASNNVSIGYNSGYSITTGANNTVFGASALYSNLTGSYATAIGAESQYYANNTATGYTNSNVSVGYQSLRGSTTPANNTGNGNTAIGYQASFGNTSGIYNVAVGYQALNTNTTGWGNVALGYQALTAVTTGGGNTCVNPLNQAGQYFPVFNPTTENNRFCMGSTAVTNAYIQVAWTVVSDARDKTDFAEVPHGLDFVVGLNPIAYRYKETRDATEGHGPVRYGFKAQDVLALEQSFGTAPVVIDDEDSEKLRMNDSSLIPILVNAIKELKAEFDAYKASHP